MKIDLAEWARLLDDAEYRVIAHDEIGGCIVSTVWLGLDHSLGWRGPPMIFETMVFENRVVTDEFFGRPFQYHPDLNLTRRYSTEAEARDGHAATVALLTDLLIEEKNEEST